MVRQHHQLNGHKLEETLGDGEGHGSLACCSPLGRKESDMTQQLNTNDNILSLLNYFLFYITENSNNSKDGYVYSELVL